MKFKVDPERFIVLIYNTLAEYDDHVQTLIEREGKDLPRFLDDEHKMQAFIREPLLKHWADLPEGKQANTKHALQYLLNNGEHVPYVDNVTNLRSGLTFQHFP